MTATAMPKERLGQNEKKKNEDSTKKKTDPPGEEAKRWNIQNAGMATHGTVKGDISATAAEPRPVRRFSTEKEIAAPNCASKGRTLRKGKKINRPGKRRGGERTASGGEKGKKDYRQKRGQFRTIRTSSKDRWETVLRKDSSRKEAATKEGWGERLLCPTGGPTLFMRTGKFPKESL